MKIEATNETNILQFLTTTKDAKDTNFYQLIKSDDYNKLVEETLKSLNENEQKTHLEVLDKLNQQGLDKEKLILINIFAYSKDSFDVKKLSEEDQKIIQEYENLFEQIHQAIVDNLQARLKFKKMQFELLHTDILLEKKETLNIKDGIL